MAINLHEKTYGRLSLVSQARTASANGSAVDTAERGGCDDVLVVVMTGTITDGTHTISVEESADGSTGWAAIPAARIRGTAPVLDTAAADDNSVQTYGAETSLRYVRVVTTVGGATTGGVYGACVICGDNRQE